MDFKKGKSRMASLGSEPLEELIGSTNEVRRIDSFVESLDLGLLGFKVEHASQGRPPYHPKVLVKLYIYGYLNSTRSSRDLERATKINLEVMWLLEHLSPDHNTISNFRRDYSKAIKKVFQETVHLANKFNLLGKKLLAGDGTRIAGQNSKANNWNEKGVKRRLTYIGNKITKYLSALAEADGDKKKELEEKIIVLEYRREKYKDLEKQLKELEESKETQISLSDPDSRCFYNGRKAIVGYNVQSVVDSKHCIPIDYEVTNKKDDRAIVGMLERSIEVLGLKTKKSEEQKPTRAEELAGELEEKWELEEEIEALFDKGYYCGEEIDKARRMKVITYVAVPKPPKSSPQAPNSTYYLSEFKYDGEKDEYTCPTGKKLITNGNWVKSAGSFFKKYRTKACKICPFLKDCTRSERGRVIQRSVYKESKEWNKANLEAKPLLYFRRQAIVEHPFGTMKRSWGFSYIITKKGMDRASADVGFIFIAYNLRRIFNLVDFFELQNKLKSPKNSFLDPFQFFRHSQAHKSILRPLNFTYVTTFQNSRVA